MAFIKKFGLFLLAQLFGFSLFSLAIVFSSNSVFSKPVHIKHALKESKVYDSVAENIRLEAFNQAIAESTIKLDEKIIKDALNRVITPSLLQQNGDKIVDGTYKWLDGTTQTPEFNIDVAGIQKQVTDTVADAAIKQVQSLPPCTTEQLIALQLSDYNTSDPFSLPCSIPGVDINQLRNKYDVNINPDQGIASNKTIGAEDIKTQQGQNVFAEAQSIPKIYQIFQILPFIFGALAVLSGIGLFFWSESRSKGIKKISIKLLLTGLGLMLIFLGSKLFLNNGLSLIPIDVTDLRNSLITFIKILSNAFNVPLLFFATNFLVFGLAGLILPKLNKHNKPPTQDMTPNVTPAQPATNPNPNPTLGSTNIPNVPSAPKVKPKPPRLIQ